MSALASARAYATIARWLGPWSNHEKVPAGIDQADDEVPSLAEAGRTIRVRVYRPARGREPRSVFLVAPGLHWLGPDDPRQDRFGRVLAAAGHLVLAPVFTDFIDLIPEPRVIDDLHAVWSARGRWDPTSRPPVAFSISFGGLATTGLAARVGAEGLERLVIYGGYGDFPATLRYSLTGEVPGRTFIKRDPLNQPVVFMSFFPYMDPPCADPPAVKAAWRKFVTTTWGRPEMKADARWQPIARAIADEVPAAARQIYLHGVGLTDDWMAYATPIMERGRGGQMALDCLPFLGDIRCPVDIVHGRDDDVIPCEQAQVLADGMVSSPRVRVYITGLYDHSGGARPTLREATREAATMARVVGLLAG